MRLGFVGTGAITSAIVTGLDAAGIGRDNVLLSPRNADIAAALAGRFQHASVATSNQDVLDGSDVVVLAIRPQIAADAVSALRFRPGHHVISLVPTLSLRGVSSLVAPAVKIAKVMLTPSVARRRGATVIYPPDVLVAGIFGRLGTTFEVEAVEEFEALSAATATAATYLAFAGCIADWLMEHGVPGAKARSYVTSLFDGLSDATVAASEESFASLAAHHATPGGLNEQVLNHLRNCAVFLELSQSLDAVLTRIGAGRSRT